MEVIKRKSETEKEHFDTAPYGMHMQISYNSYGHLAIRFFGQEEPAKEGTSNNRDTLIVFSMPESRDIIRFIQNNVKVE